MKMTLEVFPVSVPTMFGISVLSKQPRSVVHRFILFLNFG